MIALVDLAGKEHHKPDQLSAGEQQRVAIARALVTRPALLFADEPTGNLDYTTGTEILEALWRSCVERHQTVVLVTHDSKAAAYADRVLVISDGAIRDEIDARPADDARHGSAREASRRARSLSPWAGCSSLAIRSLAARRGRTALSVLGIAPRDRGPVRLARDRRRNQRLDRSDRPRSRRAGRTSGSRSFGPTGLSPATLRRVEDAPGVDLAAPALERRTYLAPSPDAPEAASQPVTAVGIDPDARGRASATWS